MQSDDPKKGKVILFLKNYFSRFSSTKLIVFFCLLLMEIGGPTPPSTPIINDDPEPWGFRGGLSGEFQVPFIKLTHILIKGIIKILVLLV